jgi:hypothetical protein
MSKERELLERSLYFLEPSDWEEDSDTSRICIKLACEVEALLAQPEQEPTTRHALDSYWNQEAYKRGYARAELDLKREPLSGQAVLNLVVNRSRNELARAIEKAHGIGVDNE